METKTEKISMKKMTALGLGALLLLSGCGDDGKSLTTEDLFDLTVSGSGFAPHNTQLLSVVLIEDGNFLARDSAVVSGGNFSFTWTDTLKPGSFYRVDYYADHNSNGTCQMPPADHGWRVEIGKVTADKMVKEVHDLAFESTVCDSFPTFNLTLKGTGYNPHNTETLNAALVRAKDGKVVAKKSTTVSNTGTFSIAWMNSVQMGMGYTVDYYADHNKNGTCQAPAASPGNDHGWRESVPAVGANVMLNTVHDLAFEAMVCDSFPPPS